MKVVIAGPRKFGSAMRVDLVKAIKQSGFDITEVVSGHAIGVDQMGETWARANDIRITEFKPKYGQYPDKVAPIKRNEEMAEYADAAIFLWDGESRGTFNMIKNMVVRDKPYFIRICLP